MHGYLLNILKETGNTVAGKLGAMEIREDRRITKKKHTEKDVQRKIRTTMDRMNIYQSLPEALGTIVDILAVQVMTFRQRDILASLKKLSIPDDGGGALTLKKVGQMLVSLEDLGLVEKFSYGVACDRTVQCDIAKGLVRTGKFETLARVVLGVMPVLEGLHRHADTETSKFLRVFQMAVFSERSEVDVDTAYGYGLEYALDAFGHTPPFLRYFNTPFSEDIMDGVPPGIRERVLVASLVEADIGLHSAPELFAYCKRFFSNPSDTVAENFRLMEYLLVRGELEFHARLLAQIETSDPEIWAVQMGCRLMLCGEPSAAVHAFGRALELKKKRTRKRKLFLSGLPGVLFLTAMLKSGDKNQFVTALACIDAGRREPGRYALVVEAMEGVFLEGLERPAPESDLFAGVDYLSIPLVAFFRILILVWRGLETGKRHIKELEEIADRAEASGHLWLYAESLVLLARLAQDGAGRNAGRKEGEAVHRRIGTKSLVDIVGHVPRWKKTLKGLIHLGESLSSDTSGEESLPSQRLIWLLEYNGRSKTAGIAPRMQKRTKKGGWTKGRPVALKNLYRNHRSMEGLTDQDMEVCGTIEEYSYRSGYYRYSYPRTEYDFDMEAALPALAGHPLIFRENDLKAPVELRAGPPELRLKKKGNGMQILMSPTPDKSGRRHVLLQESPGRFRLVCFTAIHDDMARLLGGRGLSLPAEASDDAARAVTALSSRVAVHSDLALEGAAKEVDADTTPHVHIMPWQEGISAEFRVRPFGSGGASFKPGAGSRHVFMESGGTTVSTTRNLEEEKKRADAVVAGCDSLEGLSPVDGRWQMDDPEQALEFLMELRAAKDDVVPEWPKGETLKVAGGVVAEDGVTMGIKKDREWFKATGSLDLGGKNSLALKALLEKLDGTKGRFLPLDDGSFLALTRSLKDRLEALKSYSVPSGEGVRFPPLASPALEDLTRSVGKLTSDKAWKSHCTKFSERIEPCLPGTLAAQLRPYQEEGFRWLARLSHWQVGACLADDMGLGKTLQALSVLLLNAGQGPSLVVAPLSVMANWQEECYRFAPTLVPKVFGPGDRDAFLAGLSAFDLVVTSYGLLQTEATRLSSVSWQAVVLDEAQAIKNRNSKRSRAAMGLTANFRLITTGTPVENRLDELWTLFNFINPGLLGTYNRFRDRFILPVERDGDNTVLRRLRKLISPFILRRLKTDVLKDLPQKTEVTLHVEMSREEALLYEAHRLKAVEAIESSAEDRPGQQHLRILAELTRLRQLCCHPNLVVEESGVESSKLRVFGDTVAELREGRHKALVFSQFVSHLKILRDFLDRRQIPYQYLDGATPEKKRRERINAFQGGEGDLFLISLKAGGSGLNLTAADYVIHMDPWWNPAVEDQASDRAHRIGQTRPVTVYRLVVKDSIEERIMQLHEEKRDLARDLLSGADMAGKVSAAELMALLKAH